MTQSHKILDAKFITSATNISSAPEGRANEVVFLGRSNVGKSSLINAICKRKNLAKTSSAPGKTRLINFYDLSLEYNKIAVNICFVDLPGFGYAKVSKQTQTEWEKDLAYFLKKRETIKLFLRLIDSRHIDLPQDRVLSDFVSHIIRDDQKQLAVFTKSDKLNRKESDAILRRENSAVLVSIHNMDTIDKLLEIIIQTSLGCENETIEA
ncbi:putative GTP-binding protein EngB [Campylobacterota bacterium]|nr:putative GTP-binding protein EngB [Campylobacterota bacterium]